MTAVGSRAGHARQLDDIILSIDAADDQTRLDTFGTIARTVEPVRQKYMNASQSERKAILQVLRKVRKAR